MEDIEEYLIKTGIEFKRTTALWDGLLVKYKKEITFINLIKFIIIKNYTGLDILNVTSMFTTKKSTKYCLISNNEGLSVRFLYYNNTDKIYNIYKEVAQEKREEQLKKLLD